MTKNVANNVANEKVQDYVKKSHNIEGNEVKSEKTLTEQWKKGELKSGWYYITTSFADEALREYFDGDEFRTVFTCNVKEILAPVPSYEKWNAILESNESLFETIQVLKKRLVEVTEENAKLKELLKECREVIETSVWGNCSELTDQIDEVLK